MGVKSGGFLYTSYKTRCAEIAKFWMPSILTNARDCDKIMANTAKTAEKDKKRKGKEKDKLAERRMLSKARVLSDRFSSLTAKEQMLYVYLSLEADDDGFLGNTKIFMRIVGCTQKNLDRLAELGYIIKFPSGIVAITHWRMNNAIRSDRYTPTVYLRERAMLTCSKGGVYSLIEGGAEDSPAVDATDTDGIPNGCAPATDADTQVRLGKDSIGKDSIGKDSIGKDSLDKENERAPGTVEPCGSLISPEGDSAADAADSAPAENQTKNYFSFSSASPKADKGDVSADTPKADKCDVSADTPKADKGDVSANTPKADKGDTNTNRYNGAPKYQKKPQSKPRYGNFDPNEAFAAALARTEYEFAKMEKNESS